MSTVYGDLTLEVTATIGIGPAQLDGTLPGYRSFGSVMRDGDTCRYGIREFATGAFEFGQGTYNSGVNTLSRAPSDSSNQGMPINLVGSPNTQIYICIDGATASLINESLAIASAAQAAANAAQTTANAALSTATAAEATAAAAMPATPQALTALFQTWMASLPTTLPGAPGLAWNNGGTPSIS